ncbi:esterase/lipase family protein [Pseudoduganella sp. HUAS MS19]
MATQLPVDLTSGGKRAVGNATPKEDKAPQVMRVPPKRVIPIVFLPGIMGSNLRLSSERQQQINKGNNIAWRPDRLNEVTEFLEVAPIRRQLQLDPRTTEVDSYDAGNAPTGNAKESSGTRQDHSRIRVALRFEVDSPLLSDDPPTRIPRRTKEEKARARGWGEVLFTSYRHILERCEQHLNRPKPDGFWEDIIGKNPATWGAVAPPVVRPLSAEELIAATKGCIFPTHAMGYNWLQSNEDSARIVAKRIERLISQYQQSGFACEKVILVSHSMGGLLARALIHPQMGNIKDKILGIVHGVMPALGAPAAYRRMRCGFEEGSLGINPAPKFLGNFGNEVTAVLGNAPGGLQLLPNCAYGNGWLEIRHQGILLEHFPKNGDPYGEIYCVGNKWFGLLREEWLNPAGSANAGLAYTIKKLQEAKQFHLDLADTFHEQSYAHYGADSKRPSWERIVWNLKGPNIARECTAYRIVDDNRQGKLILAETTNGGGSVSGISAELGPSQGPGDQTVPIRSADRQLRSGRFRAIFRQTGYEHQASYSNSDAIHSTLFSIVRIAATMTWRTHA